MANNTPLNLIDLDYDAILGSLRNFVAADKTFQSYDLNQGGMAAILRVLAYSQFNQTFLLNMIASESFLDSAQLKSSVASHVKELNYVPGSPKSARATITMSWTGANSVYYIQKGSTFSGLVRGAGALTFSTPETVVVTGSNGVFSTTLDVYEGPYVADAWVLDSTDPTNRFILTNDAADTSSLSVVIYEGGSTTPTSYTFATTMLGITETSRIWFLQMSETGRYEVVLGDGVLGYRPPDGSRLVADYRVTRGSEGNGVSRLTAAFNPFPGDATNISTTTVVASSGGADAEDIEQTRIRAPRWFRVQERAVTSEDFVIMLTQQFPEVRDAVATGGEDLDPPQYGRVFVAVDLSDADRVSDSRRAAYEDFLTARSSLAIRPVITDADREWISVRATAWYDPGLSVTSTAAVQSAATAAIQAWCATNLGGFRSRLAVSRLEAAITAADSSIVSSSVDYSVYKSLSVVTGAAQHLTARFGFAIRQTPTDPASSTSRVVEEYTAWTQSFALSGSVVFVADDGLGVMRIVRSGRFGAQVGTVDYATGVVDLPALVIDSYAGSGFRVYARPAVADFLAAPSGTVLALGDDLTVSAVSVS